MASYPPSVMKAWQYISTKGGLEKNLKLNTSTPLPKRKPDQHLVQVVSLALNPVDHKPAEAPLVGRFLVPKPATPGLDFAGRMVEPATGSSLKRGQLVFGVTGTSPFAGGGLAEFAVASKEGVVALPTDLSLTDASTIAVAALTAYQTIVPRVKKGDRVFINGGSGGVGVFGIQIAKTVGCHVSTTCSTANVELCKALGADQVIDYKKQDIVETLKAGSKFDHVIDNVGADSQLYWHCHEYTRSGAVFIEVAGGPTWHFISEAMKRRFWPSFLGGGKRKCEGFFAKPIPEDLTQIGKWMAEGKIKAVVDSKHSFEHAPKAFEKLKTGRARGKVVIEVAPDKLNETQLE